MGQIDQPPVGNDPNPWRVQTALGGLALLLVVILAGILGWHSLADRDIWFHLRAGRDLLGGAGFPHANTYSFTNPDFPWLNHEWLFQLVAAWTAPTQGFPTTAAPGWNILRLVLILILTALLAFGDGNLERLRRRSRTLVPAATALVALVGLLLMWPRFNLRPELISYVFFVLMVRGVERYYDHPPAVIWRSSRFWRLFVLVWLWAQCHGFAAVGPVVVLVRILAHPWQARLTPPAAARRGWTPTAIWLPLLLTVLALILTPNLWRGIVFPLRALGQLGGHEADLSRTVSELVPLLKTPNALGGTLAVFKAALVWSLIYVLLAGGRVSLLRLTLLIATAGAALSNQRNIAMFGIAFVMLHTGSRLDWPAPRWRRLWRWSAPPRRAEAAAALAITVLVCLGSGWWARNVISNDFYLAEGVGRRFGTGLTPAIYPQAAAHALAGPAAARTFANLDAAAYLLATSEAHLYVDGRTEAYPLSRWSEYLALKNAGDKTSALMAQAGVSAVALGLGSGAFDAMATALLRSPVWQAAAADAGGVLFLPAPVSAPDRSREIIGAAARRTLARREPDPTRRADLCLAAAGMQELIGDTVATRAALRQGLALRPDHPALNHNLGNMLLAEGQYGPAADHFARALAKNARLAGSALNLGVCQMHLRLTAAAVRNFRRSLAIDPGQVAGWVNLAVALRRSGDAAGAVQAMTRAVALRPGDARLRRQLQQWRRR